MCLDAHLLYYRSDKLTPHHRQSHIGVHLAGILLIRWRGRRAPCNQLYCTELSVLLGNCAKSVLIPFSSTIGAGWLNLRNERQNIFVRSYSYIILAVHLQTLTKNLTTGFRAGVYGIFNFGEKNLCKCHVMIDFKKGRLSKEPIENLENRFVFVYVVEIASRCPNCVYQ